MISFPDIDPVIVQIGPLSIRWYGLMYLIGFAAAYQTIRRVLVRERPVISAEQVEDLFFGLILGLILGARIGYMIFYNAAEWIQNPLAVLAIWQGGMSFHGGLLGVILAVWVYTRRHKISFLALSDLLVIPAPIGLGLGRIGNFINGELWGRVALVPWAMRFPGAGPLPRHPSQIYECLLEGVLLFTLLWLSRHRLTRPGQMSGLFLLLYGVFRTFAEFFREPDPQLGFLFDLLTMGQLLSGIMILAGCYILFTAGSRRQAA